MLADDIAKVRSYAPPCDRLVGIYLDAGPACVLAIMAVLHAGQAPPHLRQTPVLPSRSALSHALLAEQALVVHAERISCRWTPAGHRAGWSGCWRMYAHYQFSGRSVRLEVCVHHLLAPPPS